MISQVLLFRKIMHCKFLVFLLIVFLFFSFFLSACEFRLIRGMGAPGKQNPDFFFIITCHKSPRPQQARTNYRPYQQHLDTVEEWRPFYQLPKWKIIPRMKSRKHKQKNYNKLLIFFITTKIKKQNKRQKKKNRKLKRDTKRVHSEEQTSALVSDQWHQQTLWWSENWVHSS